MIRTFHHEDFAAGSAGRAARPRRATWSRCASRPATRPPPSGRSSSILPRGWSRARAWSTRSWWSTTTPPTPPPRWPAPPAPGCVAVDDVLPELGPGARQGRGPVEVGGRRRGRPHRLVRRRHHRLRPPVRHRARSARCSPPRHRVREGLLRPARRRRAPTAAAGSPSCGPPGHRRRCSRTSPRSCSRSSGEYAGRRTLLERLPFVQGYGVDLGLLIDIADARRHRGHRPGRPRHPPPPQPPARRARPAGARRPADGAAPGRHRPRRPRHPGAPGPRANARRHRRAAAARRRPRLPPTDRLTVRAGGALHACN